MNDAVKAILRESELNDELKGVLTFMDRLDLWEAAKLSEDRQKGFNLLRAFAAPCVEDDIEKLLDAETAAADDARAAIRALADGAL